MSVQRFAELGIRGRIGVTSGEVVAGTSEHLVTGDAVNLSARLEQAAEPGDVLIGEPTPALAGSAVQVEPLEPLVLKGKSEPVPASRSSAPRRRRPNARRRFDSSGESRS
jgi:class 3 adenylate cyclase